MTLACSLVNCRVVVQDKKAISVYERICCTILFGAKAATKSLAARSNIVAQFVHDDDGDDLTLSLSRRIRYALLCLSNILECVLYLYPTNNGKQAIMRR